MRVFEVRTGRFLWVNGLSGRTSILLVRFPEVERQPAHDANFQIPEPRRHVPHTRRSADGTDEVRSFEKTAKQAESKSYDFAHLTSHDVSYWEIILRAVRFEASGGRQSPDLFAAVSSGDSYSPLSESTAYPDPHSGSERHFQFVLNPQTSSHQGGQV